MLMALVIRCAAGDRSHVAERILHFGGREHVLRAQQLSAVDFSRRQKSRNDADQHGRQENVPLGIFDFFRQGRNPVEADVSKHRNRGTVKHPVDGKSLRIVKRPQEVRLGILRQMENVADGVPEERQNHRTHNRAQGLIDPGRGLDPAQIQPGEQAGKYDRPQQAGIRNLISGPGQQIGHRLGAPDGADQGIEYVIHRHAPAGDVTQRGMDLAAHIGVSRTRAGIDPRHTSIAHGGEHHGNHGDQN